VCNEWKAGGIEIHEQPEKSEYTRGTNGRVAAAQAKLEEEKATRRAVALKAREKEHFH
jgi:hypothetical protein